MPPSRRLRRQNIPAAQYFEYLEERTLLSSTTVSLLGSTSRTVTTYIPVPISVALTTKTTYHPIAVPIKNAQNKPAASSGPVGILPANMRSAYGVDQITFGSVIGDGTGQTIAIIDAYHYPTAFNDLSAFSAATGLPSLQLYTGTNTGPYFRQVAQDGSNAFPSTDPAGPGAANGTWEEEEALDIEWAHAMAPGANIILVEAADSSSLFTGITWARMQTGVSVISMSFGGSEYSGETSQDSTLTTPSGHTGITFVASTGDDGAYPSGNSTKQVEYPAASVNVVAVGGTTLNLSGGTYLSESAWNGSGGGISVYESKPTYQSSITLSTSRRTIPDISMDADPNTGAAVYDSYDFGTSTPWFQVGGTSLSAPMFAGLVAIADQGRIIAGLQPLDGPSQTLPALYQLSSADYHDITSGNNGSNGNAGFSAGTGYDLVTGLGTPIANLLVPALSGSGTVSGTVYQDNNDDGSFGTGDSPLAGVTVFIDTNGNGILDHGASTTNLSATGLPLAIPDRNSTGITSNLTVSGLSTITNITITFTINHTYDSDLVGTLTSPDGTRITLFSHVGTSNDNFTNTTLSTAGATSIASGSAPFSGTYTPSPGSLTSFNGKAANGTWKFKLVDNSSGDTGSLISWSLGITSGVNEVSTVTDANGKYAFSLANGTYAIDAVTPASYLPTTATSTNVTVASNSSVLNFGNFPTLFNAPGANDSFFVTLDPNNTSKMQIYTGTTATGTPTYSAFLNLFSALTPSLTFSLQGANSILSVDYSNGSPIPGTSITVNGSYNTNQELRIYSADPATQFTMTDTQIGLTGSSPILYNTVPTLSLFNGTFNYSGSLSTFQNLNINNGSTFNWS